MLLSRAELAELGRYRVLGPTPEPHMSKYLSDLVNSMLEKMHPGVHADRLVELCCRDFEFSRSHVDSALWKVLGVDKKKPSDENFKFDTCAYTEDGIEISGAVYKCKDKTTVPLSVFTAVEGNVFSIDLNSYDGFEPDEPLLVYCRPPEQIPLSQFDSLDLASKRVHEFLCKRKEQLGSHVEIPDQLSASEWYYVFLAASIACSHPHSTAVIQIPNRMLNLARAADGRRLLIQLSLLDSVVILPNTIATEADGYALLFLRDGDFLKPWLGEERILSYLIYDARAYDNKAMNDELIHQILDSIDRASRGSRGPTSHVIGNETGGIFSLLPDTRSGGFGDDFYVPFDSIASIRRGVARSRIAKISEKKVDADAYQRLDCYYLSLKYLVDGTGIQPTDILKCVPDSDIYDASLADRSELAKVREIDLQESTLIISRFGSPFKLALITREDPYYLYGGAVDVLSFSRIIPSDTIFCATFDIKEKDVLPSFILAYLSSDEGQQKLLDAAHGDAVKQLAPKDLRSITIPVPPIAEQRIYADEYWEKQAAYEQALKEAKHQTESKRTL